MQKLTLDTFVSGGTDLESRQYHVLHALKSYYEEFSHNRLYPALAELIELNSMLDAFLQQKSDLQGRLPHRIKEVDIENKRLVYEPARQDHRDLERAADLIAWALPHLRGAIEEGMEIFNFVDDHVAIEGVGLMPMYRDEGYWFVPDIRASLLHLLRYEVSLFTGSHERFRTLKTRLLESLHQALICRSPESIKMELMEKYRDLPNPATYMCETDLDFPYAETILPIAKRKLMARLFS